MRCRNSILTSPITVMAVLRTMSPAGADLEQVLGDLQSRGLAHVVGEGLWAPTPIGRREAERSLDLEAEVRP